MMQFSVYRKFVGTVDRYAREKDRIIAICPPNGYISILAVTEKQMGRMTTVRDGNPVKELERPDQLVLF